MIKILNQLAAVQSQNKQACINIIKPGSVVYWEVTLFLNYIVRVWPLSLMLLNNLQWFSMTISNKVNATQWVCLKMKLLHTENRVARSKKKSAVSELSATRDVITISGNCRLMMTSIPTESGLDIVNQQFPDISIIISLVADDARWYLVEAWCKEFIESLCESMPLNTN